MRKWRSELSFVLWQHSPSRFWIFSLSDEPKYRIVLTTSTYPTHPRDGVPRFIKDLANALGRHADVTVLAPDAPGAPRDGCEDGIEIRRFSYFWPRNYQRLAISGNRGMRDNLRASTLAKLQVPLFLLAQAWKLRGELRSNGVHWINAHWLVPQGLVAAFVAGRRKETKIALHVHAGDVYMLEKLMLGRKIARYVVRRSDCIFADGSHVRDALNRLVGWDTKAVLQPMGVHVDQFAPRIEMASETQTQSTARSHDEPFILFVGRLAEKKGTIYLVRALKILREQFVDLSLKIVGSGPEESALRAEVDQLDLRDNVQFLGPKDHPEIVSLLHCCEVAAVPSIIDSRGETEGMPTVVVESLAAGVPVVGSRVNGIPDLLRHNENGWLCKEKDPKDLAAKLKLALECDRNQQRIRAITTARSHDWAKVAENYLAVMKTCDRRSPSQRP